MKFLIVRLGALGDIVHTVPAAAALRRAYPDARIDWVVDARHAAFAQLVTVVDRVVTLEASTLRAWLQLVQGLRPVGYDVALDFQGLMKSAIVARASGARRVVGFSIWHLREKGARPFYSEVDDGSGAPHVIRKNLNLLSLVGIDTADIAFPLAHSPSAVVEEVKAAAAGRPIALINPGAAWPNKRWPATRFGEVAAFLQEVRGFAPFVLWGQGEQPLAADVVQASGGAAQAAPATTTPDLLELARAAALMVSGDTGPLHIAGAAGTPLVAVFGPTDPDRNGPWLPDDAVISRYGACQCHYDRQCRQPGAWCLKDVTVAEVTAAIQQRLGVSRP